MSRLKDIYGVNIPDSLESMVPNGILSEKTQSSRYVLEAVRVIEKLIIENSNFNALLSRFSLLQSFPRQIEFDSDLERFFRDFDDYLAFARNFALSICPDSYSDFINELSLDETEVFLKNYFFGHDTWGTIEGLTSLTRTMLESSTHYSIPVTVKYFKMNDIIVDKELRTLLGKQYSNLGRDFIPGQRFNSRPGNYNIYIGPIFYSTLEKLQKNGWADEFEASEKLYKLVGLAEPYYLGSKIKIILATQGFKIGKAVLGKDKLGVAYTLTDD